MDLKTIGSLRKLAKVSGVKLVYTIHLDEDRMLTLEMGKASFLKNVETLIDSTPFTAKMDEDTINLGTFARVEQ